MGSVGGNSGYPNGYTATELDSWINQQIAALGVNVGPGYPTAAEPATVAVVPTQKAPGPTSVGSAVAPAGANGASTVTLAAVKKSNEFGLIARCPITVEQLLEQKSECLGHQDSAFQNNQYFRS